MQKNNNKTLPQIIISLYDLWANGTNRTKKVQSLRWKIKSDIKIVQETLQNTLTIRRKKNYDILTDIVCS